MNVLITGATGFIGSHLAEELLKKGYTIRCLVRRTSNLQWLNGLSIEYVYGDLFDKEILQQAVAGMDYIYHLAGITKAKKTEEYYRGNHIATRNLLQAILAINPQLKRFVHMSSQTAVGPSYGGTPVDEQTPFQPITTYGRSKMEAEKECVSLMDKLPITIVRPPVVYGPRDKDVFEFFNTINKGLQPMAGLRDAYVSMIHVTDLIHGTIVAGEHPKAVGQIYFIANKGAYNWKEIGDITARIMNKKVLRLRIPVWGIYFISACAEFLSLFSSKPALINFEKARDMIQTAWTCSANKAITELGFQASLTIEEGIRNTVEWYRQHNWL